VYSKDKHSNFAIFREVVTKDPEVASVEENVKERMYPHMIGEIFERVTPEDVLRLLKNKNNKLHPSKYIQKTIPIPPNTIRPNVNRSRGGKSGNNDTTALVKQVVEADMRLRGINLQVPLNDEQKSEINKSQLAYYDMIKGSSAGTTNKTGMRTANNKQLMSVSRRLPGKHGRIRRNLLGRRATEMSRSFITCDPNLRIDEIGLPKSIARTIQKPVKVQEYNYEEMLVYFMNGTKIYPGASKIYKAEKKSTHWLAFSKEKLEIGDVLYRDIIDGDIVGFNRQPSLEPSNIGSHKVVIMEKGDTIRINVLACPMYNADFDGDAMNVLWPKSNRTTNEILSLSSPAQRFVSYKGAKPIFGEAQDSLIGTAELTRSETRMNKLHAMRVLSKLDIWEDFSKKPADHLYTGRDAITTYFKYNNIDLNYTGEPSLYNKNYEKYITYNPDDIKVEIRNGELISGVLDKNAIGEGSGGGIFHIINNQYGAETALDASYAIQQIALEYMYNRGVTVNMGDIMLHENTLEAIHDIEKGLIADSYEITNKLNAGQIIAPLGKTITEHYEMMQINALDPGDAFWSYVLTDINPRKNNLFKIIMSGSKGKMGNFKTISTAVGQIALNGERIREILGGRTLPYFARHDPRPESRGYIANGYRIGIGPAEFFAHSQESRYQLISRALSTAITGHYNRMAIKNLEGLIVDNQRKLTKSPNVTQILYGGDGVDPRYLEKNKFPTMDKSLTDPKFKELYFNKDAPDEYKQLLADREFYRDVFIKFEAGCNYPYSDTKLMPVNVKRIIDDVIFNIGKSAKPMNSADAKAARGLVTDLCNTIPYCYTNDVAEQMQSRLPTHYVSASRLFCILIRSYLNTNNMQRLGINVDTLKIICLNIKLAFSKSLIDYGMPMGIIAAQSISEPMTQTVLDSHHSSGAGSTKKKGMYRIQEIIGAKGNDKMKHPAMTIYFKKEYETDIDKVQEIVNHIEMMKFNMFIDSSYIFFEKYGDPLHPDYKDEAKFIKEFEKFHSSKPPGNLINWCLRITLNKYKLVEKQMKMETVYFALNQAFPDCHFVYNSDNSDKIIMRIYFKNTMFKNNIVTTNEIKDILAEMQETVIRGVPGIVAAYIKEINKTRVQEDGSMKEEKIYYLFTSGSNIRGMLGNPYIDPYMIQSDSIMETYEIFGIGATREKIIYEFRDQVPDPLYRHFTIYADEMCQNGAVTSIDRYGTSKRDISFMQRISDASPIGVIEESAINGLTDTLQGVSPCIMLGKNPRIGDLYNTFDWDYEFVQSQVKSVESVLEDL
jgi:DNA-directed RNA polymerase II subunit RPB1